MFALEEYKIENIVIIKKYKIINYLTFEKIFNKHNINKDLITNICKYVSPRFKRNEICNLSWHSLRDHSLLNIINKVKIFEIFYHNKLRGYVYSFFYFNCYIMWCIFIATKIWV